MSGEHLSKIDVAKEDVNNSRAAWQRWCRLCAKQELSDQESSSIFVNNEVGKSVSELATSVGKYFWVNIKAEDEISQCLCWECRQLLEELVFFTERVNKVQTIFCLLQNMKPSTTEEANKFRSQCGLIDEGWQHIIKPEPAKVPETTKPLVIDQQVQTDLIIAEKIAVESFQEAEETVDILRKSDKNEEYENQTGTEHEHVYEYVVQGDNELEFVENSEYIVPSNAVVEENVKQAIEEFTEEVDEEDIDDGEVQDSDLFKELKFKLEDEDHPKRFKIISSEEEVEVEYQDTSQPLQQQQQDEEDMEGSMEVLEEEVEDEDYVNTSGSKSDTKPKAFELLKAKRGRPFGSKKFDTDNSTYRFECNECKRRYKNPNIFRKHMTTVHNVIVDLPDYQPPSNSCSICSKKFLTQSSLKLHMRYHLPDEEKYNVPCPYCERKFSQVGAMRLHVNGIHHQMKPFICDQCGRACKTMAALNEHQLVHTNECPFECDVCHKRFKNKPRLKSHMDIHTKSVYKCPDCDLELNTKRTLLQHRLVHSDVKRFKCEFCEAAFKRSKALKNHLILHSGLRPYKCNFCNKAFSNGSNCRAHKKRAHPQELADEEANGKIPERVPIPRLEELKSAKSVLVQPRIVKRTGGLSNRLLKLLQSSEKRKQESSQNYEDLAEAAENCETYSDFHYEITKSDMDETESMVDNPSEECEETVIYEIIDEI